MIAYLKGEVISAKNGYIILTVSNIGYKVYIGYNKTYQIGKKTSLYIHQHIREDVNDLYGFETESELDLFEKLISVNGVGPKVGLIILGSKDQSSVIEAITSEDIGFFQTIPGIGKKVAAKVIIELKPKIVGLNQENLLGKISDSEEIVEALQGLGYKKSEIISLVVKIPALENSLENKIKWCLKNLNK